MLDDVAEKARRNLMVISSGILAVALLGIPLDGKLVGAVDLSVVEPWRAWLTTLVVLVYFTLRFHFAPTSTDDAEGFNALQKWKYRRRQWYLTKRDQLLKQALANIDKTGTPKSDGYHFAFHFPNRPEGEQLTLLEIGPCRWNGRQGTYASKWAQMLTDEKLKPGVTVFVGPKFIGEANETKVAIRPVAYFYMHLEAWNHAYQPSWNLLELTIPWLLAAGAFLVCLWRIVVSLYYEFPFVRQLLPT